MRSSGIDRAEQTRRVQAVLRWVHAGGLRGFWHGQEAKDPALRYLEEETRAGFAAAIIQQADQEGTTSEVVWARLVEAWMAERLSSGWCSVLQADPSSTP